MNFEDALDVANEAVFIKVGRRLSDVEIAILKGSWQQQTYEDIASEASYSVAYLKRHIGPDLWKLLTEALGEKVSKTNFRSALERQWRQQTRKTQEQKSREAGKQSIQNPKSQIQNRIDWEEAADASVFYGRSQERATLVRSVVTDRCRLVAVLGIGGIGKTALTAKLAQDVQDEFEYVIWRSLRNAPPLEILLGELVSFVSNQQQTKPELGQLLHYLRTSRCLLILDNMEAILEAAQAGQFRPGYEHYENLLRAIGETAHQSCVILTSREKPAIIAASEGDKLPVRSLRLSGSQDIAIALLQDKGLAWRVVVMTFWRGCGISVVVSASVIIEMMRSLIE